MFNVSFRNLTRADMSRLVDQLATIAVRLNDSELTSIVRTLEENLSSPNDYDPEQMMQDRNFLMFWSQGRYLDCIRRVREVYNMPLKEAKDAVDHLWGALSASFGITSSAR